MSESLSHDLREAWRQLRIKNARLAATCLESAGALEKAEAEVRRLRARLDEAEVAINSAVEGRDAMSRAMARQGERIARLRAREAKAREFAEKFLRSMDNANSTIAQAVAATELRDSLRRWLAEGE